MNIKTLGAMAKFKKGVGNKRPDKGQASGSAFASLAQRKFSTVANQVFIPNKMLENMTLPSANMIKGGISVLLLPIKTQIHKI